ncbi:MAG TPA: hypothetical protein VE093_22950 [Polyangiaceae bacterium]|jgi:hypothetical protein|nr:hypothetical protein [Polyangiaceae bacterium]
MANNKNTVGAEIGSVPIAELIRSMAMAVADAQFALDKSSLMVAEFMSGKRPLRDATTGELIGADGEPTDEPIILDSRIQFGYDLVDGKRVPRLLSMMELGFAPTFYQFVDTVIEVKLALRLNKVSRPVDPATGQSEPGGEEVVLSSTPIDGSYAAGYGFNLELASVFRTKLVPVPPPATLEARLREIVAQEAANAEKEGGT